MKLKVNEHAHGLLLKLAEQDIAKPARDYAQGALDVLHLMESEDPAIVPALRLWRWSESGELDGSPATHLLQLLMDFLGEGAEGMRQDCATWARRMQSHDSIRADALARTD